MANTYKNIVITPNTASSTGDPSIVFSGGNTTVNTDITLRVYPEANGTLSFEGAAGQLFSITNDLTGSIYSVNDVSGIPSIDVQANGMVSLAPYGGNVAIDGSLLFVDTVGNKVGVGTMAPLAKLEVVSSSQAATDRSTHFELSTGTGLLTDEKLVFGIADGSYSWIQAVKQATAYRNLSLNPSGGNVGIGRTTTGYKLDVNGSVNASALLVNGVAVVAPGTATTFTATQTFNGTSSTLASVLTNAAEVTTVSATAATGTIAYDITTQSILYYTSNASANWTVNFRGSSGTSLNTLLSNNQTVTVVFMVTQGATAYYNNTVQIDGNSVTPKWQGGTAPTAGNASSVDVYTYTITKTANTTFTVLASLTQFK